MSSLLSFKLPDTAWAKYGLSKGDTLKKMRQAPFSACLFLITFICVVTATHNVSAVEIRGPEIEIRNKSLSVNTALLLEDKHIQELKSGISKEFKFSLDVYRTWKMWPDEFISGKFFVRTLRCDKIKLGCVATSYDGKTFIEKRFKSIDSMLTWAVRIENITLTHLQDLEPGEYYVRVTVESAIRKLPPVIGYFMLFLPENEFSLKKNSPFFTVGPDQ